MRVPELEAEVMEPPHGVLEVVNGKLDIHTIHTLFLPPHFATCSSPSCFLFWWLLLSITRSLVGAADLELLRVLPR